MERYLSTINKADLFVNIKEKDLPAMLDCLSVKLVHYPKNTFILMAGERPTEIGIVLTGQVQVFKEDISGDRTIVASLAPSDIFSEALCCAEVPHSPITVMANENSDVLLMNFNRILKTCSNACYFHSQLIANMLYVLAKKNIFLQSRMDIISNRSIRAKVTLYLESFVPDQGRKITIPLNREEMANYLCVDRSALSHELSRMKQEGLIDYNRNKFELLS